MGSRVSRLALGVIVSATAAEVARALSGPVATFVLKDDLGLGAGAAATVALVTLTPSYLQPLLGAMIDLRPLAGSRRRGWFVLGCAVAAGGYAGLALSARPSAGAMVLGLLVVAEGQSLAAVTVQAAVVSVGAATGSTARLQALLAVVPLAHAAVWTPRLSAWALDRRPLAGAFAFAAAAVLVRATAAPWIEEPEAPPARELTATKLRALVRDRTLWALLGWLLFVIATPSTQTAQTWYVTNALGASRAFVARLDGDFALGNLAGAGLYALFAPGRSSRALAWAVGLANLALYPVALAAVDLPSARASVVVGGALTGVLFLAVSTLAARSSPRGLEATVSGLFAAALALGLPVSDRLGAAVFERGARDGDVALGWRWVLVAGGSLALLGLLLFARWRRRLTPDDAGAASA